MPSDPSTLDVLDAVRERYSKGAKSKVPELCCPVDYEARLLKALPDEIIQRDYGCGDPSRFVREGEVVLDLGSGAGKICYMASQLVGAAGRVIGVDATPDMLALARRYRQQIAEVIGWSNVEFRHGTIQDLTLDLDQLDRWLKEHPVREAQDLFALQTEQERLRRESPMIADQSVDLVLSNCVLNLVDNREKKRLFSEIQRVLKRGGRCAISDIVSDEDVPELLQADAELWSGCISGAMREDRFLQAFADAGLYGIEVASYQSEPWAIVEGIEFRAMTVTAYKGKEGPCYEHNEAVIYKGPWKQVVDDDGHLYKRGERTAVCRKTYEIMTREPYADSTVGIEPLIPIDAGEAKTFDCRKDVRRDALETKSGVARQDVAPGSDCCEPGADNQPCC